MFSQNNLSTSFAGSKTKLENILKFINSKNLPDKNVCSDVFSCPVLRRILKKSKNTVLKLNALEKKVDVMLMDIAEIKQVVLKDSNPPEVSTIYEDITSEFDLPAKNDEELIALNQQLARNQELQAKLTHHLQLTSSGRNLSTFLTSVLKKLLIKDLAMQYSRIGRKGKKSFMSLEALYRIVLAAVLMRFQHVTADDIDDKLGRALALAADWNGRQKLSSEN